VSELAAEIGFGGDHILRRAVIRLIIEYEIRTFVETGTYLGYTAGAMAGVICSQAFNVVTIEKDMENFGRAATRLMGLGVTNLSGPSEDVLNNFLREWPVEVNGVPDGTVTPIERPVLFYLDAHWPDTPVLEELGVIGRLAPDSVIVIHDVKNPNHGEFAFDMYGPQVLDWEFLAEAVAGCYTNGFTHWHNEHAAGNKVGALFVTPGRRDVG